jgi:Putative beta-barrel porin 2
MRVRIFFLAGVCAGLAILAALAQTNVDLAPTPAAADESQPLSEETPTSDAQRDAEGRPLVPRESQPRSVETPTSDAQRDAEGRPLVPRETELDAETPALIQPEEEAISEEALAEEEPSILPEDVRKRWRIIPLFSAGVLYDDNIYLTNTDRVADVIWTISFGLALQLGDFREGSENYLTAQWVGFPSFYTENTNENSFNQEASLLAQYRWTRLVGQFQSKFRNAREGNREVNTITTTRTFSNRLRFQYDYSEKTSFDLQFRQEYSESSDSTSTISTPTSQIPTAESGQTSTSPFSTAEPGQTTITPVSTAESGQTTTNSQYEIKAGMNYQMFPKTNTGFEVVGGIADQSSNPLQYYQQARLRLHYVATGKLNAKFSGGVEVREFEGTDLIRISPVFSLGLDYRPFDGTTLGVVGYRNIYPATSITGQDITATGFEISATQRILQKFIAGLAFGYENDVYLATSEESPDDTDRVDNFIYVRPRLTYSFVDWLSASVFYEFRRTDSNQTTNSFYDNRVGMELALTF